MNQKRIWVCLSSALIFGSCLLFGSRGGKAAEPEPAEVYEYATLRWAGRENTHVIRPSGNVEFIGAQLTRIKKPDRADERSFYMNIALNALAREGYELAAMTPDDYVLKRRVGKDRH